MVDHDNHDSSNNATMMNDNVHQEEEEVIVTLLSPEASTVLLRRNDAASSAWWSIITELRQYLCCINANIIILGQMKRFRAYIILLVGVVTLFIHLVDFVTLTKNNDYGVLRIRQYYYTKEVQEKMIRLPPNMSNHHEAGFRQEHDGSVNDTLVQEHPKELPLMSFLRHDDRLENNASTIIGESTALSNHQHQQPSSETLMHNNTVEQVQDVIISVINDTHPLTTVILQASKDDLPPPSSSSTSTITGDAKYQHHHHHHNKDIIECWSFQKRCAILLNHTATTTTTTTTTTNFTHDNNNSSISRRGRRHNKGSDLQKPASKTLALNDPMLRGGYRNQFMRFVSFVIYALQHGFDEILLPSIRWNCDHRKRGFDSVGFEHLFDVEYWNEHRHNNTNTSGVHLPRMVAYNESDHYDWDPFTGIYHGACNVMETYLNEGGEGKHAVFNRTGHYQHPPSFGGGYGLGHLFYHYMGYDAHRQDILIQNKNATVPFLEIEAQIIQAMRPTATVERILQQTLNGSRPPYIALHARIEPEMLVHSMCTTQKVYNLTTIFDMIRGMDHDANIVAANPTLYIAIGLPEMLEGNPYSIFRLEHSLNMAALQDALHNGYELPSITGQNLTVSAGAHVAIDNSTVDACANEIVSSVISFEIAVRANIFIGTYISTWSTTVWKARHALGREGNYAYTPGGLVNITGFPPPFRC